MTAYAHGKCVAYVHFARLKTTQPGYFIGGLLPMSDKEFLELMYDAVPKNRNNIVPLITISRNKSAQYDGLYVKPG